MSGGDGSGAAATAGGGSGARPGGGGGDRLRRIARRVWSEAEAAGFRGSDPYDGLRSRRLAPLLVRSRLLRLATIQAVKRSPWDLRPLLDVPPGRNPKGLALFLDGAARLPAETGAGTRRWLADALLSAASRPDGGALFGDREPQVGLAERVAREPGLLGTAAGWGYDFPWQSKAFLQPAHSPTVVATSFAVEALTRAGSPAAAAAAAAAARFVTGSLHRHETADGICFSYSPGDRTRVYNASLFGARVLARAEEAAAAPDPERRDLIRRAVAYVLAHQREDGSWRYGEAGHWRWVDGLHTGFVLETLADLARSLDEPAWRGPIRRGLAFYRARLLEPDGTARYYSGRRWPLDAHTFAQAAITLLALRDLEPGLEVEARRVLERAVAVLWDERRGGFRFQAHRRHTIGTIHLRWSQGWMFRALALYLAAAGDRSAAGRGSG